MPTDITLTLPAEYFDALSEIMATGFKYTGVNPRIRKELEAWWEAESEFIREEFDTGRE